MSEFNEPWSIDGEGFLVDRRGVHIGSYDPHNWPRIAACVNICAGLSTADLERIDGRMLRVLQPQVEQVSQVQIQGGNGEEARLMGAAAGKAPRSVPVRDWRSRQLPSDIEEIVERLLAKRGILQPAAAQGGAR